jgi:hypothetical protein
MLVFEAIHVISYLLLLVISIDFNIIYKPFTVKYIKLDKIQYTRAAIYNDIFHIILLLYLYTFISYIRKNRFTIFHKSQ